MHKLTLTLLTLTLLTPPPTLALLGDLLDPSRTSPR
jgi:hypothetical protein